MWPQISGILDFGDFGFWILGILDFGFWILGILDFGFWGFWILDFGLWGFWILDFGPLCSKSLCEAPNAPNLGIWNFGFWGFWGFWILGILYFGFWILGILDFEVWGMEKFGCKITDKFWILHKSKKTVHAAPGRRIFWGGWLNHQRDCHSFGDFILKGEPVKAKIDNSDWALQNDLVPISYYNNHPKLQISSVFGGWDKVGEFLGVCKKGGFMSFRFVMESWQAMPQLREVWVDVDPHGFWWGEL